MGADTPANDRSDILLGAGVAALEPNFPTKADRRHSTKMKPGLAGLLFDSYSYLSGAIGAD